MVGAVSEWSGTYKSATPGDQDEHEMDGCGSNCNNTLFWFRSRSEVRYGQARWYGFQLGHEVGRHGERERLGHWRARQYG